MEDAQFPSVAGDAQSTPQRRSGLRLGDAEAVATTRLDMFGDNALKKTLASAPPNPAEPGASNGTAPEDAADQPPPFLDAVIVSAGPASPETTAIEVLTQPVEAPAEPAPSDDPQGLDAPNDTTDVARDLEPVAAPARLQLDVPDPSRLSAARPGSAAPAAHMEFSPVYSASALHEAERRSQAQWNGEDTPAQPPHEEAHGQNDAIAEAASDAAGPPDAQAPMGEVAALEGPDEPAAGEPEAALPDSPQAPAPHDWSPPFLDAFVGGEPSGLSSPPPFREELAPPVPVFDAAAPPEPELDPAAKIAAEADATAQALENLKRLLENTRPDLEPVVRPLVWPEPMVLTQPLVEPDEAFGAYSPRPRVEGLRIGPQTETHSLAGTTAPLLPLTVPPPPERSRKGLYLLGFLSGLGLSLMTGIVLYFVLYFVINTIG